jgi:hypothetical protein
MTQFRAVTIESFFADDSGLDLDAGAGFIQA